MAESKKITQLDSIPSVSNDDEFVIIDKSQTTGADSSASGKTSKVTMQQLRDGMFPDGAPQGEKGLQGPQGIQGMKGEKGSTGTDGTDGDSFFTQNSNGISYNEGNIAVGTSSTTAKLEVQGDIRISRNSTYASHWHMGISHTDTSDYGTLGFYSNSDTGDVAFYPNGAEIFRIKKSGEIQYRNGGDDGYSSQVEYIGNDDVKLHFGPNYSFESGFRKTLTLDNNKVGIGTTDPSAKLEIKTETPWGSYANEALTISNSGSSGTLTQQHGLGKIKWVTNASPAASIDAIRTRPEQGNNTDLVFSTNTGGSSVELSEKMRISSNGNVGIGIDNPHQRLHTYVADSYNQIIIETGGVGASAGCQLLTPDGKWVLENRLAEGETESDFVIRQSGGTAEGEKFVVKQTSGNIGIGTSNPSRNLTVAGNFRLEKRDVDGGYTTLDFNSGGGADEPELNIYDKDGNPGVFTLKDGNVGIGIMNPDSHLHVSGVNDTTFAGSAVTMLVEGTNEYNSGSSGSGIGFVGKYADDGQATTFGQIYAKKSNNASGNYDASLCFATRRTGEASNSTLERMRISSDGNVGIGTMDPDHKLEVKTPGGKYAVSVVDDTTSEQHLGGLFVNNHGATTDGLDLYLKQPGGSTKVAISSNGTSYFTGGNVGIGNKLPGTYKLNVSGSVFALGNIVAEGSITTQDFQVNGDFTYSGADASELNDIKVSELRGIETLSKINICDFEKDGTKKTGIVADDLLNAMPSALKEYKKTVEVGSAIGNVVHGNDESELIVRSNVSKQEFDDQEWPETYKFVETGGCDTEEVTKLAIDQQAIIAMLIKSVQELNGKVNRLNAEVRKNK